MDADYEKKLSELKSKIKSFPDFPKPGILFWHAPYWHKTQSRQNAFSFCNCLLYFLMLYISFYMAKSNLEKRDIFSAISDGSTCKLLQHLLVQTIKFKFPDVEAIIGLESRGFLFAFSLAAELGVGCLPVRKKGKLPGEVISYKYELEYGTDILEIQKNTIRKGLKCLIIDDLIATGGTITAASKLLQGCGANVIGCLLVIELNALQGRHNIPKGIPVHSLIQYD